MIIAVHQPHYLPWLGYFHKVKNCDCFVFLDKVQYEKRGFQNRNKIRTPEGSQWLSVPVITKDLFLQEIKDVLIDNSSNWQKSHWGLLKMNYIKAPFFEEHEAFFSEIYSQSWKRLIDLNLTIIKYIFEYLGFKKKTLLESSLGLKSTATQRIIDICKKLNADTYYSGVGAKSYLVEDKFKAEKIKLFYQEFEHSEYEQQFKPFMPNMSIVDLLFNCGKDSLNLLMGGSR